MNTWQAAAAMKKKRAPINGNSGPLIFRNVNFCHHETSVNENLGLQFCIELSSGLVVFYALYDVFEQQFLFVS